MPSRRPYAKHPGSPPSVTEVLRLIPAPGLPWAAAKETAIFAVKHPERWQKMAEYAAIETLRKHHRGVWDHRALMGTALHEVNAAWAAGEEAKIPDILDELRSTSPLWGRMQLEDIYAEFRPMVEGLTEAWKKLKPDTISFEEVVRYQSWDSGLSYVGSTDWRAVSESIPTLFDLKTTGNLKPGSAKYWDSWRLQLAAYRFANEVVFYDDDDEEIGSGVPEPVELTRIIHVRANGDWEVETVAAGQAEHETFLRLRQAYGWLKDEGTWKGHVEEVWKI